MGDLELSRTGPAGTLQEIPGTASALERSPQTLVQRNPEGFPGVCFPVPEFSTGRRHGGRLDTLGMDANGSPVVIG